MMRLLLSLLLLGSLSCKTYAPQAIHVVEDCIAQDRPAIAELIKQWTSTKPSWADVEHEAVAHGLHIGGCAIHEFANLFLTPAPGNRAPSPEDGWSAHAAIALFDKEFKLNDNVTFKTPHGNL